MCPSWTKEIYIKNIFVVRKGICDNSRLTKQKFELEKNLK